MKKSVVIALHAGYWLLYEILFTAFFIFSNSAPAVSLRDWDDLLLLLAMATVTGATSFYIFYLWLVPKYLPTRRFKTFVGSGLVVSFAVSVFATLAFSILITLIVFVFFRKLDFFLVSFKDQMMLAAGFALLAMINGVVGTVMRGFITWFIDIREKQVLANSKLQTEIALIKAQINPHFLFNSLNNIDVLIEHDSKKASQYLNKLSDLLRYVLYEARADWITLEKELAYIRGYIELQKIRTTNEDYVVLEVVGSTGQIMIPSMILVPYIENAFKYATNKKNSKAIRISIIVDESEIQFHCANCIDKPAHGESGQSSGLGNKLLEQRLTLLFQDRYQLEVDFTEKEYVVDLRIPIRMHELFAD